MTQYKDKGTEFSAYRMLLAGVSIAADMLIVLAAAVAAPQMDVYVMCVLCLAVIIVTLVLQIRIDHTAVHSGEFLIEDGKEFYVAAGIAGVGFGKHHRQNRRIRSYRFSCLDCVKKVDNFPFGIRVKAEVYTATTSTVHVDKEIFEIPGAMRKLLEEQGKKKTAVFRIEHNLKKCEEERLLHKLESMVQKA